MPVSCIPPATKIEVAVELQNTELLIDPEIFISPILILVRPASTKIILVTEGDAPLNPLIRHSPPIDMFDPAIKMPFGIVPEKASRVIVAPLTVPLDPAKIIQLFVPPVLCQVPPEIENPSTCEPTRKSVAEPDAEQPEILTPRATGPILPSITKAAYDMKSELQFSTTQPESAS